MSSLKFEGRIHLTSSSFFFFMFLCKIRMILETPGQLDISYEDKNSSAQHKVTFFHIQPNFSFQVKKQNDPVGN